ncbi:MAG: protein kinase [Deltaproteobacteria bacterium]|nr:protein kinase [Deltaproteobacteria bacterium]
MNRKHCSECEADFPLFARECARCGRPLVLARGTVIAGQFTVERLVASGGMSQVYLASQESIQREVALKVVAVPDGGELGDVDALKNEAFLASRIHHPHIVSIFDHGEFEGNHFYLAMEFLHGQSVARALAQEGPVGWVRALRIMLQVCEALDAVHEAGVIHRDLKPGNLYLMQTEGQEDFVKLLDFGLATGIRRLPAFFGGGLGKAGTPLYMSPEQIRGKALDERSDLYAVGAITYELITGDPVFSGIDPLEEHLKSVPSPISIARPQTRVPRALDDFLLRLLAKSPAQRPPSVDEVIGRFKRMLPASPAVPEGAREPEFDEDDSWFDTLPRAIRLRDPDFIGRERELSLLDEALTAAQEGRGSVNWFTGERGSGKTTLGIRFQHKATERGFLTASSPTGSRGSVMGSWRAAMGDLLGVEGRTQAQVRDRLTELADVSHDDPMTDGVTALLYPGAAARDMAHMDKDVFVDYIQASVEGFLRRLTAKRGLVLRLDDFHEADTYSIAFLDRLCRQMGSYPCSLVVLVTSMPVNRSKDDEYKVLRRAMSTVKVAGGYRVLSRMTERDVVALIESMSQAQCSGQVRRLIHRAAGGNPMFAVHMYRHLGSRGAIALVNRMVRLVAGADTSVPKALLDLLTTRIEDLAHELPDGAAAAELLTRVAMLGRWAAVGNLWSLVDREGRKDLRDALDPLVDRLTRDGFLNRVPWGDDDSLVFTHPLMGEAIRGRPRDSTTARLHLLTAQVLETAYSEDIGRVAADLGRHYIETGYLDTATDYLLTAGEAAMEDARFRDAGDLYREAEAAMVRMRLEKDSRMKRVHLALAELSWREGRYEEADERLKAMGKPRRRERDTPETLLAVALSARVAEARRRPTEALSILQGLVEACEARGDHHRAANALVQMADIKMDLGENGEAARLMDHADDLVHSYGKTRTLGLIDLARGRLMRKVGSTSACLDHMDRALEILSGPRDFIERAEALFFKGAKLLESNRTAEAEEIFRIGVGLCEQTGFARGLAGHLNNLGTTLTAMGRVEEARDAVMRAQAIREQMGDSRGVAGCLTSLADLSLNLKEWKNARELALRSLELYRRAGYVFGERISLVNLGFACRGEGDIDQAERYFRECLDTTKRDKGVNPSVARAHEALAGILEDRGDLDGAVQHRLDGILVYEYLELHEEAEALRRVLRMAPGDGSDQPVVN